MCLCIVCVCVCVGVTVCLCVCLDGSDGFCFCVSANPVVSASCDICGSNVEMALPGETPEGFLARRGLGSEGENGNP